MLTKRWLCNGLVALLFFTQALVTGTYAGVQNNEQAITIEVKASETAKLKELLEKQKAKVQLADGTALQGQVTKVMSGAITVKVERSEGVDAMTKGEHSIAPEKLTSVKIVKYNGKKRAILATALGIGGAGLGLLVTATEFAGESGNSTYAGVIIAAAAGGAASGYAIGKALDKKEVTILIK